MSELSEMFGHIAQKILSIDWGGFFSGNCGATEMPQQLLSLKVEDLIECPALLWVHLEFLLWSHLPFSLNALVTSSSVKTNSSSNTVQFIRLENNSGIHLLLVQKKLMNFLQHQLAQMN